MEAARDQRVERRHAAQRQEQGRGQRTVRREADEGGAVQHTPPLAEHAEEAAPVVEAVQPPLVVWGQPPPWSGYSSALVLGGEGRRGWSGPLSPLPGWVEGGGHPPPVETPPVKGERLQGKKKVQHCVFSDFMNKLTKEDEQKFSVLKPQGRNNSDSREVPGLLPGPSPLPWPWGQGCIEKDSHAGNLWTNVCLTRKNPSRKEM